MEAIRSGILGALERVKNHLKLSEIDSIGSNVENADIVCVKKDLSDVKVIPLKGKKTEKMADVSVKTSEFQSQCPPDEWYRIWTHTHNIGLSNASKSDVKTAMRIRKANMGNGMCSAGLDGITCALQFGGITKIVKMKWNSDFYTDLVKKGIEGGFISPLLFEKNGPKYTVVADQVICTKYRKGYICGYRDWNLSNMEKLMVGQFTDLYALGKNVKSGDVSLIMPSEEGEKVICHHINSDGSHLLCR